MSTQKNTIFITGGGSGIGKGLAEKFHAEGHKVLISGRNRQSLVEVCEKNPGIDFVVLDVSNFQSVLKATVEILAKYPNLNVVVNNAGIQKLISFQNSKEYAQLELDEEIDINLKGLIYITNAFLPHLLKQPQAQIIQVSSGLALTPLAIAPIYSATKAAVHSFTVSLRAQLKGTNVKVIEILPPAVETNLHVGQIGRKKVAMRMPLEAFLRQTMNGLKRGNTEIHVGLVKILRYGARFAPDLFFKIINK
jgi:uncharacterized oxidoreductase